MKYSIGLFFIIAVSILSCNNNSGTAKSDKDLHPAWKKGVALFSFHRHPFETAIAMADTAGVRFVEGFSFYKLGTTFNDSTMGNPGQQALDLMQRSLKEKNISMTSMYVEGAENAEDWKRYFELGKTLGLEYIVCEPDKAHWDIIDSLAGIYGIKIAIHEHAKGISAYWHPDSVIAAIKGHSNIGACADLGHWARSGLDVVECLRKLEGHIIGIHLKDISEAGNPNAKDVNPGTGVIDFPAVLAELKRQKFTGYIQVECEHNLDNNVADVKDALRYIDELAVKETEKK